MGPPTLSTKRRSSSESPAASRSPSPSTPRPAGSSTTPSLPTPSLLSTMLPTMPSTMLPLSTMDKRKSPSPGHTESKDYLLTNYLFKLTKLYILVNKDQPDE